MKRIILALVAILALVFAFGSVGAYDHGNIGFLRLFVQVGIAIGVEWYALTHLDA
jgi:hypothetical protein